MKMQQSLTPIDISFEHQETDPIEEIVGGCFHLVFRSREGKVFAVGYNTNGQATFSTDGSYQNNLTECPIEIGKCIEIGAFSSGEYLRNDKDEVYFIGAMFTNFKIKQFEEFSFVQRISLKELSRIGNSTNGDDDEHQFNDILNTGWQCCIFHNPNHVVNHHDPTI